MTASVKSHLEGYLPTFSDYGDIPTRLRQTPVIGNDRRQADHPSHPHVEERGIWGSKIW